MMSIWMHKGETIAAFVNCFQCLLPADNDSNQDLVKYLFISKLLIEVQTTSAIGLYEKEKSFDKIANEFYKVQKCLLLSVATSVHGAECEFCTMEQVEIISCSTGSPWAAPLHMVKKPCGGHVETTGR